MADFTAIRNALAAQITAKTGLRCDGQARDQVSPPCSVVLPGQPYIIYGATADNAVMGAPGALSASLRVLLIVSDAAPVEKTQRALDAYLGIGPGEAQSVPDAILADPTLAGSAEWCELVSADNYGRIEYNGVIYFGARLNLTLGAT